MYRRVDYLEVVGYIYSDLGGCFDDRRSTFGYIFMMVGGAISWKSKKQTFVPSFCYASIVHCLFCCQYSCCLVEESCDRTSHCGLYC